MNGLGEGNFLYKWEQANVRRQLRARGESQKGGKAAKKSEREGEKKINQKENPEARRAGNSSYRTKGKKSRERPIKERKIGQEGLITSGGKVKWENPLLKLPKRNLESKKGERQGRKRTNQSL